MKFLWWSKKIKKIVLYLLLIFISLSPIMAKAKLEISFEEIDKLIEERDYNTALSQIEKYLRQNPEDFDNAQKRIEKILEARKSYADLVEELITVIENEPLEDKKKLDMIAELESMEKNPSPEEKKFIQQTKAAAQFTYYRALFDDIMTRGKEQVLAKNYIEANNIFYSGFDMYKQEFYDSEYSQEIKDSISQAVNTVDTNTKDFVLALSDAVNAQNAFANALQNEDINETSVTEQNLINAFTKIANIRNTTQGSGWTFTNTFNQLKENDPELTEASYLPFIYRFTLGKPDDPETGLIASMNHQWNDLIDPLNDSLLQKSITPLNDISQIVSNTDLASISSETTNINTKLSQANEYLDITNNIFNLYNLVETSPDSFSTEGEEKNKEIQLVKELVTYYQNQLENTTRINTLIAERNNSNNNATQVIQNQTYDYYNFIQNKTNQFTQIQNNAQELKTEATNDTALISDYWDTPYQSFDNLSKSIIQKSQDLINSSWDELALFYQQGSSEISKTYSDSYENAESLLNRNKTPNESGIIITRPTESLALMNTTLSTIDADQQKLNTILEQLESAPENTQLVANTDYSKSITNIQNDINNLTRIKQLSQSIINQSNQQIAQAQRSEREAEQRYSQAQRALRSEDFDTAKDNIQRARDKYNESLSYNESQELREYSDRVLVALGQQINDAENQMIIREVRELKTDAKSQYYLGNFDVAETLLLQAETRWAVTNIDKDPEIESQLALVRTALSMKTGRTIPPTAALYPEMSQLLNIAYQYYEEGQELIKNNRTQAIKTLNQAKSKLQELQLVYPMNQEASLLTLRIDKLIDEQAFENFFSQKYETAKIEVNDATKQQTAYMDLLDLYEINPNYPGLANFIYETEINIGIRVRPPNPQDLRRSTRLTQEASNIIDTNGRDEIALNSALTKLNEALELNSDNETAMRLKDEVLSRIGGQSSVVLSASDEEMYQRAIQELQKGNTIQAAALVNELLKNRQNQSSSKIQNLKKKVDALL